jgi:hypothetical protein
MSWKCALGLHRPSLVSITRKANGLHALCEGCDAPLEKNENGRWKTALPLVSHLDAAGKAA